MAGQGIGRREVLRILTIAAAAATFPGFSKWTFACGHVGNAVTHVKLATYHPLFFNASEHALVERLTDILIPSDATPGARDAGVAEFIDLMASRDPDLQRGFGEGLAWLNRHSAKTHGKQFVMLSPAEQIGLLEPLAYKAKHQAGEERGREFFQLLREYTVMGFYTSEVGLKELDFPGLKFYAASPSCPHTDDPEHLHLAPAKW
jgi:gluconate 2-dehydrogenase gamma chain